jgi:peptidoglycan/xylan/chitin deacetylase (PgdA/CDA1 family)
MLLYYLGAARPIIWWRRNAPRVVVYHACEPIENDFIRDLGSNVTPQRFSAHLDFYGRYYRVVPVTEFAKGTHPQRALAITFDDGYRSVFVNAFPQLQRRNLTATVYLVSDAVESGSLIWVNELNWYLHRHPAPARSVVLSYLGLPRSTTNLEILRALCAAYDREIVAALLQNIRAAVHDDSILGEAQQLHATWDQVQLMLQNGIAFGNHTATHPNLTRLTEAEQYWEITSAQAVLSRHIPSVTSFAYPFGRSNARTESVAGELGFRCLLEVGPSLPSSAARTLGRVTASAETDAELFSEIEIVYPVKMFLRSLLRLLLPRALDRSFGMAAPQT